METDAKTVVLPQDWDVEDFDTEDEFFTEED